MFACKVRVAVCRPILWSHRLGAFASAGSEVWLRHLMASDCCNVFHDPKGWLQTPPVTPTRRSRSRERSFNQTATTRTGAPWPKGLRLRLRHRSKVHFSAGVSDRCCLKGARFACTPRLLGAVQRVGALASLDSLQDLCVCWRSSKGVHPSGNPCIVHPHDA